MAILGLDISSSNVIPALVDDAGLLKSGLPDRLTPSSSSEMSTLIAEFSERLTQHFQTVEVEVVTIVDVDLSRNPPSSVRERAYLEASVFLAAHNVRSNAFFLHQQAIASHLGLEPRSSKNSIRDQVLSMIGDASLLSPEPIRRARALGAAWAALESGEADLT